MESKEAEGALFLGSLTSMQAQKNLDTLQRQEACDEHVQTCAGYGVRKYLF